MIDQINDVMFPTLLFLLIYSFLWEFVPDLPRQEPADPTPAIKEAFSEAFDPEPRTEPEWLSPASESLPSTIRALRQYIREYNLQELIKQRTGKTVSQCVKEELIAALV